MKVLSWGGKEPEFLEAWLIKAPGSPALRLPVPSLPEISENSGVQIPPESER